MHTNYIQLLFDSCVFQDIDNSSLAFIGMSSRVGVIH